jgi:hypothetical protein
MEPGKASSRCCAIYTRKSSEEGLEQDFNSLHAQREACESYIKSQQGEGWRLVKTAYDDGGLSGATMNRPALQRLVSDVRERLIGRHGSTSLSSISDAAAPRPWTEARYWRARSRSRPEAHERSKRTLSKAPLALDMLPPGATLAMLSFYAELSSMVAERFC